MTRRRSVARVAGCLLLLLAECSLSDSPGAPILQKQEFVGTTPGDASSREFIGGLPADAPCHCITWDLTLFTDQKTGQPATYSLVAKYGLPGRNDPNQIEDGPALKLEGRWEISQGHKANPQAVVYRLHGKNLENTLSVGRVGEHLFHFLDRDQSLKLGNAGWSYTLNRKGVGKEN
jgi:hypothetical protein